MGAMSGAMGGAAGGPTGRALAWARANLFAGPGSSFATVLLAALLAWAGHALLDWGLARAVWSVPHLPDGRADTAACRAPGAGACWAVAGERWRLILFGAYPRAALWRPAACVAMFAALFAALTRRRNWRPALFAAWIGACLLAPALMRGGWLGLAVVPQNEWGGLPLTLMLACNGLAGAMPLAVALALGRRARGPGLLRTLCAAYVMAVRGVPLVGILFMAGALFPLLLPPWLDTGKLARAQLAMVLFAAAYLAEAMRAGLGAVPPGQAEAAAALGLGRARTLALVTLPQALRLVAGPLLGIAIGFLKDTSLVAVIGLADLMATGHAAVLDPAWQGSGPEVYGLLAAIYFLFCFSLSRAARRLGAGAA